MAARVLIADEQHDQCFSLELTFSKAGFEVFAVEDHSKVMPEISRMSEAGEPFAVVLVLDKVEPLQARLLGELESVRDVPVVLVANVPQSGVLVDMAHDQDWACVEKPFHPDRIITLVRQMVSGFDV